MHEISYSVIPRCGSSALADALATTCKPNTAQTTAIRRVLLIALALGSERPEIRQDIFLFLREQRIHRHWKMVIFQEPTQIFVIAAGSTDNREERRRCWLPRASDRMTQHA